MIGATPISLFDELVVLPDQTAPAAPTRPELRLMAAVLAYALDDLRRYHHVHAPQPWCIHCRHARNIREAAADWVRLHDEEHAFSFARVCIYLGLDEDATRRRLLR